MRIAFWLLWPLGTVALVFGWLLAQAPATSRLFDLVVWSCAAVLLMTASLILIRKSRAVADPSMLVFLALSFSWLGTVSGVFFKTGTSLFRHS